MKREGGNYVQIKGEGENYVQTKGEGEGCYQVAVSPVGRKSRLRERKRPSAGRGKGEGGQPKDTPNLVGEKEK